MSERTFQSPSGIDKPLEKQDTLVTEEMRKKYRESVIASRGFTQSRLKVELPDDLIGEWVRNESDAIAEAEMKGFVIDTEYATKNSLHHDGSGKGIVGDVIHMVKAKWMAEEDAKMHYEQMVSIHGAPTSDAGGILGTYVNTPPVGMIPVNESSQTLTEIEARGK